MGNDLTKRTSLGEEVQQNGAKPHRIGSHAESAATPAADRPFRGLQQTVGNQAMLRLLGSGAIRASLRLSQPGDADEVEADRTAERVLASPADQTIHRKCNCEGGGASCPACEEDDVEQAKGIHRKAQSDTDSDRYASEDLTHSLGSGEPLDSATRGFMEPRFGRDFGSVRIHTGDDASNSAQSIQARAFTAGDRIVFANGEYSPHSRSGAKLLAHELTHVAQNHNAPKANGQPAGTHTAIKRQSLFGEASESYSKGTAAAGKWWDEKKWAAYRAMIAGLKTSKNIQIGVMRAIVPKLPASLQGAASTITDIVDFFLDMVNALLLAIVGLAVGFVEGIAGLIAGLIKLALGFLKMAVDYLVSLMGRPDEYMQDVNDLVTAIKGIPPGLTMIKDQWLERYRHATLEEQVLMGGELVGQIEAFIATFAFAGTKAGQATTFTVRAGDFAAQTSGRAAVLAPARAIAITIPAVVPKTATEAAVISSQMMAMSTPGGGGAGSGGGSGGSGKGPLHGATDKEIDKALKQIKPAGDPLELQPHSGATDTRKALGVSGKDVQSTHGAPQSVMKPVAGYNAGHALTRLLDRAVHFGMDSYWKESFIAMRSAGRTQATAQEVYDIVAESIRRAPGLPIGEKNSMIARLSDEMFMESGLKPGDVLDLPYPNVVPK